MPAPWSKTILFFMLSCGLLLAACTPGAAVTNPSTSQENKTSEPAPTKPPPPTLVDQPRTTPPPGMSAGREVVYDILAQGDPANGGGEKTVTWVIRGDDPNRQAPAGLPEDGLQVLSKALEKEEAVLYAVIYAGPQPSSGYSIQVHSIMLMNQDGKQQIVVTYSLQGPGANQAASAVITHPYLIARLREPGVQPEQVIFQEIKL